MLARVLACTACICHACGPSLVTAAATELACTAALCPLAGSWSRTLSQMPAAGCRVHASTLQSVRCLVSCVSCAAARTSQGNKLAGHGWLQRNLCPRCAAAAGPDPDRPAIVWVDEAAPTELHSMSLGQLALRSAHVADALRAAGLQPGAPQPGPGRACPSGEAPRMLSLPCGKPGGTVERACKPPCRPTLPLSCLAGDPVALNTPMTADAVVAFLGVLLAGCVAVAIADSFAAGEIANRLRIAGAKAVITQVS